VGGAVTVLETRTTAEGYKRRRYAGEEGTRYTTIEIPLSVWNGINKQGRGSDRAAAFDRERSRENARQTARALMGQGWKAIAVASHLGVPLRSVQRWRNA
jgi:transcriptional regulator NrdR family protein